MARNIEIKARVKNVDEFKARAEQVADAPAYTLAQEDTYFYCPTGRMKLRMFASDRGQLIFYDRPDRHGPKRSDYRVIDAPDPRALRAALAAALGVRGVVAKTRHLYLAGQTRIHLDNVEGLGWFMELEVVLSPVQNDADGTRIAEELMHKLGVCKDALLDKSYIDLLDAKRATKLGLLE